MKKLFLLTALLYFCGILLITNDANAFYFNTHKDSIIKAFDYMDGGNGDYIQKWIANYLRYIGGNDIDERMGTKNGDTDNFKDTSIGGWWIGYRTHIALFGFEVNYTSFWHFLTMFRTGHNGNAFDGYSYKYSLDDGFWGLNGLIKSGLYNQDVRNKGNAGRDISSPAYGKGVKDAYKFKYQLSGSQKYYSSTSGGNYDDYQDIIFEPCSNSAAYWYSKALENQSPYTIDASHIEYLGHVMHMAGDVNVTQHVWDTSDHNHTSYEEWVDDHRDTLYNEVMIRDLVEEFKDSLGITSSYQLRNITLQEIFTFFGNKSLNMPAPLYSEDLNVRLLNGEKEYNGAIAINVIILEKYIYDLYLNENSRKF